MHNHHASRGQAFPIWIGAAFVYIVSVAVLGMYGSIFAAQVRAQNAAESAANAIVGIQSQEWNEMVAVLYLNDVEEYRLRNLLEAIRVTANGNGGCSMTATDATSCAQTYLNLTKEYMQSLTRYDNNTTLLSKITSTSNFANIYNDGQIMLQLLKAPCSGGTANNPAALDCSMTYSLPTQGYTARVQVQNANFFPQFMLMPSFTDLGVTTATPAIMAPIAVEVAACTQVYPMLTNFFGHQLLPKASFTVIARAAATNAAVSENWISPGIDQIFGSVYQPTINYGPNNAEGENWYGVDFGGQTFSANTSTNAFTSASSYSVGMSARMGWWGPVPIHSFMGPQTEQQLFGQQGCPP